MFKYTPKKQILRDMDVPKVGDLWDKEFFKRKEILKKYSVSQDYNMTVVLKKDFKNVCHYSVDTLKYIPVRGFLFPVAMFNEEKVV